MTIHQSIAGSSDMYVGPNVIEAAQKNAAKINERERLRREALEAGSGAAGRGGAEGTSAGSRSVRFLHRVDAHLDGLPSASARAKFLAAQLQGWENRYRRFIETQGRSEEVAHPERQDPPQAADYQLTISGLAYRLDVETARERLRREALEAGSGERENRP